MSEFDKEVERIDAGEDAWDEDDEEIEVAFVKKPLDKVVPIRLTDAQWRALRVEGEKVGVGPSTLARMWLIERLSQKPKAKAARKTA